MLNLNCEIWVGKSFALVKFAIMWISNEMTGFHRTMENVTSPLELELNSALSFSRTVPKNRDGKSLSWVK